MTDRAIVSRRALLGAAGASALAAGFPCPALAQSGGRPLKIGMVTSLSGPYAGLGDSMRAGLQLLVSESGGRFAGRPVELAFEDDQAKPDEGVRKFRKLLGQDGVDIVCGVISSGVALAARDVVTEAKALTFISAGSANDLARKAASPFVFRPTKTNWMLGHTAGLWAYDKVEKSGGITVAADYAAGREYVADFVATYQQQGGRIAKQVWTPLGTADFGPLLTTLATEQPKFVYSFFAGSDAVRFLQQMAEYRLAGRVKLVGTGALFDQEDVLPAVGGAANGAVNTFHQVASASSSAAFSAAYRKARGKLPGEMGTSGYVTGQVIKAAVEAVSGDVSDKEKVRQAVLAQPVETAFGAMAFDPRNNQAILDIHVCEVKNGENAIVHTYKGIKDPGVTA